MEGCSGRRVVLQALVPSTHDVSAVDVTRASAFLETLEPLLWPSSFEEFLCKAVEPFLIDLTLIRLELKALCATASEHSIHHS
ncbi:hypothetical protein D3C77_500160 [compost metagenome]